jgi:hypothetical protein
MTVNDAVPAAQADNYIGMSAYELAYLLSNQRGSALSASLSCLRLEPSEMSPEVLAAAASSLVARELLLVEGENLDASGLALAVTSALVSATRWTEIGYASAEQVDGVVFIESPMFSVLCQPRMLGAWLITVVAPGVNSAQVIRRLIDAQVQARHDGSVAIASRTAVSTATLFVRGVAPDVWEVAAGATSLSPEIPLRASSSQEVDSLLDNLFSDFSGTDTK